MTGRAFMLITEAPGSSHFRIMRFQHRASEHCVQRRLPPGVFWRAALGGQPATQVARRVRFARTPRTEKSAAIP